MPRVALIHSVPALVAVFGGLMTEMLPHVATFDLVDGSLLAHIGREGRVTSDVAARVFGYISVAEGEGADAVLVTCSSIGPIVDAAAPFSRSVVLRVDDAMADTAVEAGQRVGVLATLRSTLEPTTELVERKSHERGRDVMVRAALVDGAFEAVSQGDTAEHDRLVGAAMMRLAEDVDVVVLAQASMARVVKSGTYDVSVPVLSSPELAVERLKRLLTERATAHSSTTA